MEPVTKVNLQSFRKNLLPAKLLLPKPLIDANEKALVEMDFPNSRQEAWKYTRLNRVAKIELESTAASPINWEDFNMVKGAYTFVFQNTTCIYISSEIPEGISIKIGDKIGSTDWLSSINESHVAKLNVAHAQNGCVINIAKGVQVDKPIQIIYITDGPKQPNFWRNQLQLEIGAKADVHIGYFSNNAHEAYSNVHWSVFLKENSHLVMTKIQNDGEANFHFSTENISQLKDSNFTLNTVTLNGSFVRNDVLVNVEGDNCETHLNGAYIMKENQHVDNHTTVDHIFPNCNSYELYKGVLDEKSTAVFNGKVFVRPNAQKINAFQSNANVLLSNDATVNSKPELEIYADDVKCSHGSTTGQLDEEAVFYLRSRGISDAAARQMVVAAFMQDVFSKIVSKELKAYIYAKLANRFSWQYEEEL
jgi:Fe-S cluster assembly protein SufD